MTVTLTSARRAMLVALATILALFLPGPAYASGGIHNRADAHGMRFPSDRIGIDVVTVNGSGCPAGTAAVAVSPDNTSFRVTYSDYRAQAGGSSAPTDFRKNCQLNLLVHSPQGFTYAIAEADYHGYAHLRNGATGLQRASYYFQGSSETAHLDHPFSGPLYDDWESTDTADVTELVYAPCGEDRNLNINTELRVYTGTSNPHTTSYLSMDTTDGSIDTIYHFAWKQCP